MHYVEACDASPLNAAINRTGMRVVVGVRLGSRPESPVAWAVQREHTGEWMDVDIINYPTQLGVNADAWEPLLAWPKSHLYEKQAIGSHLAHHDEPTDGALQDVPRRTSCQEGKGQ